MVSPSVEPTKENPQGWRAPPPVQDPTEPVQQTGKDPVQPAKPIQMYPDLHETTVQPTHMTIMQYPTGVSVQTEYDVVEQPVHEPGVQDSSTGALSQPTHVQLPPTGDPPGSPSQPPSYEASVGTSGGFHPPKIEMYPPPSGAAGQGSGPRSPPRSPRRSPPPRVYKEVHIITSETLGPRSTNVICPNCGLYVATVTTGVPSPLAWMLGTLLCIFGFWPCACIPCIIDGWQSVTHSCPNCDQFIGRYEGGSLL